MGTPTTTTTRQVTARKRKFPASFFPSFFKSFIATLPSVFGLPTHEYCMVRAWIQPNQIAPSNARQITSDRVVAAIVTKHRADIEADLVAQITNNRNLAAAHVLATASRGATMRFETLPDGFKIHRRGTCSTRTITGSE